MFWIWPTLYLQFDSCRFSALRTLTSASAVLMVACSTSCHQTILTFSSEDAGPITTVLQMKKPDGYMVLVTCMVPEAGDKSPTQYLLQINQELFPVFNAPRWLLHLDAVVQFSLQHRWMAFQANLDMLMSKVKENTFRIHLTYWRTGQH